MIPEQESAEAPATTVESTADLTAECTISLGLGTYTDLANLQGDVTIVHVGYNLNGSLSSERRMYTKR